MHKIQRDVAIGDVHGGHSDLIKAGLIDSRQNWIGGATHLVQLGDVVDRGDDSRNSLDLIASLEPQPRKARGPALRFAGGIQRISNGEFSRPAS